jgi:hypothetical protein
MKNGELEYFQETLLIDHLASEEFGLRKQAGVLDLLSGAAESIKSTVSQNADTSSPEGIGASLIRFMTPSILFRLHPIVGVLYLIGTAFGFDITIIYSKIMSVIQSKTSDGKKITPQEVTEIGKQIVTQEAGPMETEATFYAELKKCAQYSGSNSQTTPKIPWLLSDQKAGPIQKIFGQLFEARKYGKAKWLLGGFIIWIVKTVLAGIGLLSVTNTINNKSKELLHSSTDKQTQNQVITEEKKENNAQMEHEKQHVEQKQHVILKPSGRGTKYFHNDNQNIWIINLLDGSPEKTLLAWAIDIYPSLSGYHEFIQNNPNS